LFHESPLGEEFLGGKSRGQSRFRDDEAREDQRAEEDEGNVASGSHVATALRVVAGGIFAVVVQVLVGAGEEGGEFDADVCEVPDEEE